MTRQDYQLLSDTLAYTRHLAGPGQRVGVEMAIRSVATALATSYDNFDRDRFLRLTLREVEPVVPGIDVTADDRGTPHHDTYCSALGNEPCDCGLYQAYPELAPVVDLDFNPIEDARSDVAIEAALAATAPRLCPNGNPL